MFYALEPNSKYEVVVQSKNKWGWSQTSKPFFFKTRATGKPYVITNLMIILSCKTFLCTKSRSIQGNYEISMNEIF